MLAFNVAVTRGVLVVGVLADRVDVNVGVGTGDHVVAVIGGGVGVSAVSALTASGLFALLCNIIVASVFRAHFLSLFGFSFLRFVFECSGVPA